MPPDYNKMNQITQKQRQILKAIIDQELYEIEEEMATQDNAEISSVIAFHLDHSIRDAEQRLNNNEPTELEMPYGVSDALTASINRTLLKLEVMLRYYYRACYFGSVAEQADCRRQLLDLVNRH